MESPFATKSLRLEFDVMATLTWRRERLSVWWVFLLQGIAGIFLGVMLITVPSAALVSLVTFLGVFFLMNGMFSLVQTFVDRSVPWIWSFLIGISGAFNLLIGVLLLSSTALAVPLVFATLLLVEGASLIMLAFRVRT